MQTRDRIREKVRQLLAAAGKGSVVGDDESLFLSGRLGSLQALQMIVFLGDDLGYRVEPADFDIGQLDTVEKMALQVDQRGKYPRRDVD